MELLSFQPDKNQVYLLAGGSTGSDSIDLISFLGPF